jgi:YD repeat-containing protein
MSALMPRLLGPLLLALALGTGAALAAPDATTTTTTPTPTPEGAHVVHFKDDKLTVDLHDVSIATAMADVARASGADLVGTPREDRRLTMVFEEIPIKEALERLVGAQNFTLKYDDAGKLKAIELRGGQAARDASRPETKQFDEKTLAKQYAFFKAFDTGEAIPLNGDLRKKFGKDEIRYDELGNLVLGYPDAKIREAAMRAILQALDRDPERKAAVLDALNAMTTDELMDFARARAYHNAEMLVRLLMRESSDPDVRARARDVLRDLRNHPYKGPKPEYH